MPLRREQSGNVLPRPFAAPMQKASARTRRAILLGACDRVRFCLAHFLAPARHVRPEDAISCGNPSRVNGPASVEVTRGSPCVAAKTIWKAF